MCGLLLVLGALFVILMTALGQTGWPDWQLPGDWEMSLTLGTILTLGTLVITAIIAIASWRSAAAARKSAVATQLATEAQLYSQFLAEYASDEMLNALRTVRSLEARRGEGFAKQWLEELRGAVPGSAHDVDKGRRQVRAYFFRALRLYEAGYVDEDFVKNVGSADGINVLFDVVEDLERALNPDYDKAGFDKLRELCGRPRTGRLIEPVPPAPQA